MVNSLIDSLTEIIGNEDLVKRIVNSFIDNEYSLDYLTKYPIEIIGSRVCSWEDFLTDDSERDFYTFFDRNVGALHILLKEPHYSNYLARYN